MFVDLETEDDIPQGFDACIVGAGIAGLTCASSLQGFGWKVLVVEAGGMEDEARSQSLYDAEADFVVERNTGVADGRFRVYGGSGTRWGGQVLPLADAELSVTTGDGGNPSPMSAEALAPHTAKIEKMLGLGSAPFDASCYALAGRRPLDIDPAVFSVRFAKWLPWRNRNIGRTLEPALRQDKAVVVLLHANAVEIVLEESRRSVRGIRIRSYGGREITVSAAWYVLAAGTIEVCRLLLCSRAQMTCGVGNQNDLVGRGFMDHVLLRAGVIAPTDRKVLLHGIRPFYLDGVLRTPRFELTPAARADHGCLSGYAEIAFEAPPGSVFDKLRTLLHEYQSEGRKALSKSPFWPVMRELPDVLAGFIAQSALGLRPLPARSAPVIHLCSEQPPRSASRIYLARERDAIGMRKVVIDWSIGADENRTLSVLGRLFEEQLGKSNAGTVQWIDGFSPHGGGRPPQMGDQYHHLGGTRMNAAERDGVVDLDCRVHGVENLYIASGSTFPCGGCSNPTFTIMALSVRLAEHLASER
jgi:choline dehydrogenase-like flavoprotein